MFYSIKQDFAARTSKDVGLKFMIKYFSAIIFFLHELMY